MTSIAIIILAFERARYVAGLISVEEFEQHVGEILARSVMPAV